MINNSASGETRLVVEERGDRGLLFFIVSLLLIFYFKLWMY